MMFQYRTTPLTGKYLGSDLMKCPITGQEISYADCDLMGCCDYPILYHMSLGFTEEEARRIVDFDKSFGFFD